MVVVIVDAGSVMVYVAPDSVYAETVMTVPLMVYDVAA